MEALLKLIAIHVALGCELAAVAVLASAAAKGLAGVFKAGQRWNDLGQLAAVAAIRAFLNLFLEQDVEAFSRKGNPGGIAP